MKAKYVISIITSALLVGCASTGDPTLASGVYRKGGGIYSVNGMGFRDPTRQAVKQCELDGKELVIMTSTTKRGLYSGKEYPELIFKCE